MLERPTSTRSGPSRENRRLENLEEVAQRISRGDSSAFRQIVAATSPQLVRLAARILGSLEEAEDVVQEAYVKAYRSLTTGRFEHRATVRTWLYRVVSNAAIDAGTSCKILFQVSSALGHLLVMD